MVFYTDRFVPSRFAGCTRGPVIFIRPKYSDDAGLLAHEKVHVRQFWRSLGLFGIPYLLSKSFRLRCEVEAYREQLRHYPDDRSWAFAGFLADKYNLGVSREEAHRLLVA